MCCSHRFHCPFTWLRESACADMAVHWPWRVWRCAYDAVTGTAWSGILAQCFWARLACHRRRFLCTLTFFPVLGRQVKTVHVTDMALVRTYRSLELCYSEPANAARLTVALTDRAPQCRKDTGALRSWQVRHIRQLASDISRGLLISGIIALRSIMSSFRLQTPSLHWLPCCMNYKLVSPARQQLMVEIREILGRDITAAWTEIL